MSLRTSKYTIERKPSKSKSPSRTASSRVKNPMRLNIFLSNVIQSLKRGQTVGKAFISGVKTETEE